MPLWDRERPTTVLTKPHRLLHSLLTTMGFNVEDEVAVQRDERRVYRLDCYIDELHMGFECDGKRVHAGVQKQKHDRSRDEWIFEHAGIPVMRIQADALQWRLWEELKPQIMEFIERFLPTIDERRSVLEKSGIILTTTV